MVKRNRVNSSFHNALREREVRTSGNMSTSFAFGFSGDDIEEDNDDGPTMASASATSVPHVEEEVPLIRTQTHKLEDLVGDQAIQYVSYLSKSFR